MKLVVIISHNVKHDLSNPTNEQLREIGHDLVVLYDKCSALAAEVSLEPSQWFQGDSLERQMLDLPPRTTLRGGAVDIRGMR
jgi:hypothetical protein